MVFYMHTGQVLSWTSILFLQQAYPFLVDRLTGWQITWLGQAPTQALRYLTMILNRVQVQRFLWSRQAGQITWPGHAPQVRQYGQYLTILLNRVQVQRFLWSRQGGQITWPGQAAQTPSTGHSRLWTAHAQGTSHQCCGSGSGLVPASMGSLDQDSQSASGSRRAKMTHRNRKS